MYSTHIHQQFAIYLLNKQCLSNNLAILLSISGGQDSLSLLKIVSDFQPSYQWKIGLIYFDHKSRSDSYLNLQQILNICKTTQLEAYIYENTSRISSETKYREWRYNTMLNITIINYYSKIIIAHTLTDLSETFFQYILRGTSIDSLSSIISNVNKDIKIGILRPLLEFKRSETLWIVKKFCLPIWSDYTNYDCYQTRNRLREELIPYLQQYFQPQILCKVYSLLKTTKADIEYLHKVTTKLYFLVKHPSFIAINYWMFVKQPVTLQYRIIKLFFKHNLNLKTTTKTIYDTINVLKTKRDKTQLFNTTNLKLVINHDWLYVTVT
uniref:tRNA(Ile)-lysidine synthase n=1 Tax=Hildenbrandia rivularis TaxID=135206 RepID=A0A1C9CFH4_9FLOR|nr:tRNA(Ile)-lysidine synthase [Hildenbrandia rivularis]AOM67119.1 tRNA(Ile)-lysidine synthase [Hildenbrandia rivularis]